MTLSYLFISLFLCLLALKTDALFERSKAITRVISPIIAINQFKNSDYLSLLLFYSSLSQKSKDFEDDYITFAEQNKGLYKFFALDCDALQDTDKQVFSVCYEASTEDFPILIAFQPYYGTGEEKRIIDHIYTGAADADSLKEFAESNEIMPNFFEPIHDKGALQTFIDNSETVNKILLFIEGDEVPPLFRALSSEFRGAFGFGKIFHGAADIHHQYDIEKYPSLVIVRQNDEKGGEYENVPYIGDFEIEALKDFIRPFAVKKPTPKKPQPNINEPPIEWKIVTVSNLRQEVSKEEKMVLIHLHTELEFPIMDEVTSKFRNLFVYYKLDCTSYQAEKFAKDEFHVDYFPGIAILPLGKKTNLHPVLRFAKYNNIVEIMREVSDVIADTTLSVKSIHLQDTIARAIKDKRPIFVLLHDAKEISMSYRVVSQLAPYKNKAVFANVKTPSTEITERFGILRLPSLIALFTSESAATNQQDVAPDYVQMARFNDKYGFNELSKFVEQVLTLADTSQSIPKLEELKKSAEEPAKKPQPVKEIPMKRYDEL